MGQSCLHNSKSSNGKVKQEKMAQIDQNIPNQDLKNNNQPDNNFFDTSSMIKNRSVKQSKIIQQDFDQNSTSIISKEDINSIYSITDKILGQGSFGTVKEANLKQNPTRQYAIKKINKQKLQDNDSLQWLHREIDIFKQLDHPNIAKLYESYENDNHLYLVMEICNSEQLLQRVINSNNNRLSEQQSIEILCQIFQSVKYLHELGIVHRDLKPENFLFSKCNGEIKMIDFGLSKQYKKQGLNSQNQNQNQQTTVGTANYIAPEVLTGYYDKKCDIWSLGIIAYAMMCGEFPFQGKNEEETLKKITSGVFSFKQTIKLSKQVKDLMCQMICVDSKRRISIAQALNHPWFQLYNINYQIKPIELKYFSYIQNYSKRFNNIQRLSIHLLQKILENKNHIQQATAVFRQIDEGNIGLITIDQLQKVMTQSGYNLEQNYVKMLIQDLNKYRFKKKEISLNGFIEYSQFLEITFEMKILQDPTNQELLFNYLDYDSKGHINMQNINNVLLREQISIEAVDEQLMKCLVSDVFQENSDFKNFQVNKQQFSKALSYQYSKNI